MPNPRELIVFYDADGVEADQPKKLHLLIGVPDENWVKILNDPEELLTVMQEALITAIRALAQPGDDLVLWVDRSARTMIKRISKSSNDDKRIMPLSYFRSPKGENYDA